MGRFLTQDDLDVLLRKHALNPVDWKNGPWTDYWLLGHTASHGGTAPNLLSDAGWTTTTLALVAGSGADFMSSSDKGAGAHINLADATDLLQSPSIFGDYQNAKLAAILMAQKNLPQYLVMDVHAAFAVHTADENRTGFGLVADGGTAGTAADEIAWIYTDGSNFTLRSGADSDAGDTDDGDVHWFRIVIDRIKGTTDGVEWFIDGTRQGSMDITQDQWPVCFGAYAHTTNRVKLHAVHIYYAWKFPVDVLSA